jgi:hypothetical protein
MFMRSGYNAFCVVSFAKLFVMAAVTISFDDNNDYTNDVDFGELTSMM